MKRDADKRRGPGLGGISKNSLIPQPRGSSSGSPRRWR
jgi:hypothetical protein